MKHLSIIDVVTQPAFAPWFRDRKTWSAWFAFLSALFALPMSAEQLEIYSACTGRSDPSPQAHREAVLICGRRSGKSFVMALVAVFLAVFRDWRPFLSPGERATVMVIAADRNQANQILNYVRAFFTQVPMLARLLERETAEAVELSNRTRIQINSASFSRVRGYAVPVCLCDELAFWSVDEAAANPDREILAAIRPAMAQFGENGVLLLASSPYAKRGVLHEEYQKHFGVDGDPVLVWKAATRTMNPTIPQSEVDRAIERDPYEAASEFLAQFRDDIASYVDSSIVQQCTDDLTERPPHLDRVYVAGVDPSGGSSDSMTLAIAHLEGKTAVLDLVREVRPPFSPAAVVEAFAKDLHRYQVWEVFGDNYAAEWVREPFRVHGISYEPSGQSASDFYQNLLPMLNSRAVRLIEHPRLQHQLCSLERRTTRNGKDLVTHLRGAHDDVCNAAAIALVKALEAGAAIPHHRMQRYGINVHDFLADPEANAIAAAMAEERLGYWNDGPDWNGVDQQSHGIQ